ncbi:uncharacterized protein LOC116432140 [Nomia melanderi]|uniref:uncharacterized protein LOC116432140 n=1 Tax=Nomia melanderi TaxID=2448451 RepID=UPI0013040731|nr:uncharacterized protein LOC116432140 [Nomia melanderi]
MFHRIWGLFHITDFHTLIRPYVLLTLITGYFPYKVASATFTFSKIRFVWSTVMVIACTLLSSFSLYWIYYVNRNDETSNQMYLTFMYTFGIVLIWSSYVSLPSKLHLLRILSDTSRVLSPEAFNNAKWILLFDVLRTIIYISFLLNSDPYTLPCYLDLVGFYMFFVGLLGNITFNICLFVLRLCLVKVNATLTDLKQTLTNDEPHLLRRIYHTQKNPALLTKLKTIRKHHLKLGTAIGTLNEVFGSDNVVIITITVIDMTFKLYTYLVHNTDEGKIVTVWSENIEYLFYHSFNLIVLTISCEMIKDQGKRVGFNIHRILLITFDEQVSTELELFSMQVIQQNHTILAKGLVLDVTLLTKVVGVITTYLLILIQFLLVKPC